MRYKFDPDRHDSIFGNSDDLDETPGRKRRCRSCGDWHRLDKPWPHNCRQPGPARNRDLSVPQLAKTWDEFAVGLPGEERLISTRAERREYMAENDFVDYDEGIKPETDSWTYEIEQQREMDETIKRYKNTDTDYWPEDVRPELMGDGDLSDGSEIDTSDIEMIE